MEGACDDDDGPRLEGPGVRLERDAGCTRWLQWRCHFTCPADELVQRLVARGLRNESRLPGLADLELGLRHRLVVVPGTGRVQLRLDIGVPRDGRPEEALRVATWLAREVDPANDAGAPSPLPER